MAAPTRRHRSVRKYVRGRTRAEVSRKFDALRQEAAEGLPDGTTTAKYLAGWVQALGGRNLRPTTRRQYARHVESYWTPAIGRVELVKLMPSDVERAMAGLDGARPVGDHGPQRAAPTLRRCPGATRCATAWSGGTWPPWSSRPRPIVQRCGHSLRHEVARLVESTRDDPFGPLFALAVASGLRLGELVGLVVGRRGSRGAQPDRQAGRVPARTTERMTSASPKTKRSRRTVMLPALGIEAVRRQKARQAAARLAAGSAWQDRRNLRIHSMWSGRPVIPGQVSQAFRVAADRLGLTDVRFHDLRHTARDPHAPCRRSTEGRIRSPRARPRSWSQPTPTPTSRPICKGTPPTPWTGP